MENLSKEKYQKRIKNIQNGKQREEHAETLNGILAEKLVEILVQHVAQIDSVKNWVQKSELPESTFYRIISEKFGKPPGHILREVKFETVVHLLKKDLKSGAYAIAIDSGFGSEDALRMFLRRRYNTNISKLRLQILKGSLDTGSSWADVNS